MCIRIYVHFEVHKPLKLTYVRPINLDLRRKHSVEDGMELLIPDI